MNKKLKLALAVILLLLGGYLLYRYFFYTCCARPQRSVAVASDEQNNDPVLSDPDLLYARRALIGLCRTKSGDGGSCHFNTYMYASGKLVVESGELAMMPDGEKATKYPTIQKELSKSRVDQIVQQIRDSGIMHKSCKEEMIMDYYVTYALRLDGITKEVRFPGCESEFKEIDKLVDAAIDQQS